ncbi:MAG: hypothetical protein H6835_07335 [Planctomycetes bacterium]|nr:hypothetical protein [Planctomycetota bacterium]
MGQGAGRPELLSVEVGRLVDIYSYRIIDPNLEGGSDRRMRSNRRLELVAKNVIVNAGIGTQSLFTQTGAASDSANFEFRRFDKEVGHEQLVILWDDRDGAEQQRFQDALAVAQEGLSQLPASYRGQNTQTRPIPIVARNAAVRLRFSSKLDVTESFFATNPSAVQVLEFKGDPAVVDPADAFRILPVRVIPNGDSIILDTTILGGEANGGVTSPGMPLSSDSTTANIRIAIPTRGSVSSAFYVREDAVRELQGVDSAGRASTIRDFRSGNLSDGAAGRLSEPEAPQIVSSLSMGITAVDSVNGIITLNKRLNFVPVRGRYPFVDGPLTALGGGMIGKGPAAVPLQRPLVSGDILTQEVVVQLDDGSFETVTVRAEVLENLSVVSAFGDPAVGTAPNAPNGPNGEFDDFSQGAYFTTVNVRVATVSPVRNSDGDPVSFRANTTPAGEDCLLRAVYVDDSRFLSGSNRLSDRNWKQYFVRIEPNTGVAGSNVAPNASVAIEFTKPMDLDQVDNSANLLITNTSVAVESFADQMTDPKVATRRVVPTRLTDLAGDGTVLRLQPPMGFAHVAGAAETYCVHVRLGDGGVVDLAGQSVQVFDDISAPQDSWSVDFTLDAGANSNLVGWHTYLFEAEDEDGTLPGSVDMFGQFRLEGGRLTGASAVRLKRSANSQNLATISRINRGECWDSGDPLDPVDNPFGYPGTAGQANTQVPPVPGPPAGVVPISPSFGTHPGNLYWAPLMADQVAPPAVPQVYEYYQTVSQPVGRVIEPLKPQGSRMQMRYIEDDFSLSYTQPSEFSLDVEQLYWSPFNNETVLYDVFDRFTMSLAHARTRPDERWLLFVDNQVPPVSWCTMDCASLNSSLSTVFADNVLQGTSLVPVFEDEVYTINPNAAIHDQVGVAYVPFPRFDRSYTWRDSRLVTVDATGQVIGLGGAQNPGATPPASDTTANIDSPWITSQPDPDLLAGTGVWTQDTADFVGSNQRDHDPIALPLLVDFKVFAENAGDPNAAQGRNGFQVAMLGPPSNFAGGDPGGYYDSVAAGCGGVFPSWPRVRVQASGGFDLITGAAVYVDPANTLNALPTVVKDAGLGSATTALFTAASGDGMLHWTRADMVRKVSTVTFGFLDTLRPQLFVTQSGESAGLPDWSGSTTLRPTDLVVQLDPPQTRQPAGTGVVVELRGAETFLNDDKVYNPVFDGVAGQPKDDTASGRGNLLNANYACEAYRYSTANVVGAPRVAATGLTPYVTEDKLSLMRNAASGLLPRYLNVRLVMTNNVSVTPSLSPSLRSMSVVYRLVPSP